MATYLLKYGEIGLKGMNRPFFINKLKNNILKKLNNEAKIKASPGRLYLETEQDFNDVASVLNRTFGIMGWAAVKVKAVALQAIIEGARELFKELDFGDVTSFKVETRRSDKSFPLTSPQTSAEIGSQLLSSFHQLKVDVHNPDLTLYVEIRDRSYLYIINNKGAGGLPVGTGGQGLLLLSGGIDSPVAGYQLLKRGLKVYPIHFHSPPYTNERSLEKVKDLARILKDWGGAEELLIINFTPLQELLLEAKKDLLTILMRRMMMRIAEKIALQKGGKALVTGESLGQVASQTIESMHCTQAVVKIPVLRPLIGFDKTEIIAVAKEIETYQTSILPFADCCQVFVPSKPVTRPILSLIEKKEANLDFWPLIKQAVTEREVFKL